MSEGKIDQIIRELSSIKEGIRNLDVMSHKFLHYMQVAPRFSKLNEEKILSFKYGERHIHLWLPRADVDYIQGTILMKNSFFEEDLLRQARVRYITPGMRIAEVGGNIGNHTVYFSSICNAESIHVFEPNTEAYDILMRNISLNGCKNVHAIRAAVADRCGSGAVSFVDNSNLGGTQVAFDDNGNFPIFSLDSISELKPNFIKIDVEGMALNVLNGAANLIEEYKPILMVELWSAEVEPAKEFLARYGYRVDSNIGLDYFFSL